MLVPRPGIHPTPLLVMTLTLKQQNYTPKKILGNQFRWEKPPTGLLKNSTPNSIVRLNVKDGRARTRGHKRSRRLPGSGRSPAFRKRYWISGGINLKSFPNSDPREPEELPGLLVLIPRRESLGWLAGEGKSSVAFS